MQDAGKYTRRRFLEERILQGDTEITYVDDNAAGALDAGSPAISDAADDIIDVP